MMERKSSRDFTRESIGSRSLQKKLAQSKLQQQQQHVPDLTDLMNDMFFFGMAKPADKTSYDLTGTVGGQEDDVDDFESSTGSNSSRLTQEWLEQARQIVASSPSHCDSPSRLVGSPRFAAAAQERLSPSSKLDRRDPLSRSARRHRPVDGCSGEILRRSAKHSRNRSETFDATVPGSPTADESPSSVVQRWFTDLFKPPSQSEPTTPVDPPALLPPRQSTHRRSRFQTDPSDAAQPQGILPSPRRTFKSTTTSDAQQQLLSPPKNLIESAHRRSASSATCSVPEEWAILSPPRSLVESAHRRSISSSTCATEKILPSKPIGNGWIRDGDGGRELLSLNGFLKEQRIKIGKLLDGEVNAKAKIVLSGPSNSTSSMVAAISYAWLLENRMSKNKSTGDECTNIIVPVMNFRRARMWKQRQAAWLFHHVGIDASSLLFADEVDLENLMMAGKLNILVIGQDVLKTNGEVGSHCTILTDNFCEEAYDLLQTASLKKLLLAGILLDTQNLNTNAKLSTTRDVEAVQLLLVGSAPNCRNALFDQLMQDPWDNGFTELLRENYGKPPSEDIDVLDAGALVEHKVPERKSTSVPPNTKLSDVKSAKPNKVSPKSEKQNAAPAQKVPDPGRGKNTFFLAKWFGFGSK